MGLRDSKVLSGTVVAGSKEILVVDPRMEQIYHLIRCRIAAAMVPVLIQGETGTGKELVAAAVHHWSPRASGPFVAINCAALPEHLVEAELFGYVRGAFTGAEESRAGLFEAACGGTLFLDELGELSLGTQAKLLRVLETQRVRPLGQTGEVAVNVRIVAATNRSLNTAVRLGTFRRDLFFRLKGACLILPPLRKRPAELTALAVHFLSRAGFKGHLTEDAHARLQRYDWPGNARELMSAMDYLALVSAGDEIDGSAVDEWVQTSSDAAATGSLPMMSEETFRPIAEEIAELERDRMKRALRASQGNRTKASELIGMPLRTFSNKLRRYGLGDFNASR